MKRIIGILILLGMIAVPVLYAPVDRQSFEATVVAHLYYSKLRKDFEPIASDGRPVKFLMVVHENKLLRVENLSEFVPSTRSRIEVIATKSFMKDRYYFTGK